MKTTRKLIKKTRKVTRKVLRNWPALAAAAAIGGVTVSVATKGQIGGRVRFLAGSLGERLKQLAVEPEDNHTGLLGIGEQPETQEEAHH